MGPRNCLSDCVYHSNMADASLVCTYEPSEPISYADTHCDTTVTMKVIVFAHMAAGCSEKDLIVICEHAAALVLRCILSKEELHFGKYDIQETFTVRITR